MNSQKNSAAPLITIITVVFNAVEYIETTIKNVMSIKYENLSFIVIDGGSTDGTVEILKRYESAMSFWISEKDKGIYDAFNKGWAHADDDSFILYLGAGDKILSLPNPAVLNGAQAVYGNVQLSDQVLFRSKADFRLRLGNTLHHQALLIRKRLNPQPPFDLAFKTYADFDFNQRLMKKGVTFVFDNGFISYALPGGVSEEFNIAESVAIVKRNFGSFWAFVARAYYFVQRLKNRILN